MKSNVQHRKHTKRLNKHKTSVSVHCILYLQLWLTRHRWETTQIFWPCNARLWWQNG